MSFCVKAGLLIDIPLKLCAKGEQYAVFKFEDMANSVKSKLLAPFNGAEESELKEALKNQWQICNDEKLRAYLMRDDRRLKENAGPWTILHYLVIEILKPKGYVLFYQQPDLSHSEEEKHYYQLTLSNEF
ncbi:hypothetical protein RhiirA1_464375 [Rhizophagus irregularis]|uniref:Uncharacterized protein n=1 Tax=Rhizophagus irregularis TaxID=588596 RepID=A0A2N0RI75_9GLOM|nr:hypothetical protein RhiirA1_464375 [Rhizophagus irregularis]